MNNITKESRQIVGDASISLIDICKEVHPLHHDMLVKQYMMKWGIRNVRGGTFINPTKQHVLQLKRDFDYALGACNICGYIKCTNSCGTDCATCMRYKVCRGAPHCYYCGASKHYINDCPYIFADDIWE